MAAVFLLRLWLQPWPVPPVFRFAFGRGFFLARRFFCGAFFTGAALIFAARLLPAELRLWPLPVFRSELFDDEPDQRAEHNRQKQQRAAEAEPAQRNEQNVGGGQDDGAQPHSAVKSHVAACQFGNNLRAKGIKHGQNQIQHKQDDNAGNAADNRRPVQPAFEDVGIIAFGI